MKIAVTYDNGNVMQHFGRTEEFLICNAEDGEILSEAVIGADGNGHGELPGFLKGLGVDVVICGGLGRPMMEAVLDAGMKLSYGAAGDAREAAAAYLAGTLTCNDAAIHAGCSGHH